MKFRRRQLILASLVVALGAAVYLNWQFSDNKHLDVTNIIESTKELGEAKYVNANMSDSFDAVTQTSAKVSEDTKKYFAEAQVSRQRSRDEATESIKKVASDDLVSKQLDEFTKTVQQESNIENLIKAKGFKECMAYIQNGECSVTVNPGNLNEKSAVVIRDIVSGQAGVPYEKIKIVEAK